MRTLLTTRGRTAHAACSRTSCRLSRRRFSVRLVADHGSAELLQPAVVAERGVASCGGARANDQWWFGILSDALLHLPVAKAVDEMIVDDADRLLLHAAKMISNPPCQLGLGESAVG